MQNCCFFFFSQMYQKNKTVNRSKYENLPKPLFVFIKTENQMSTKGETARSPHHVISAHDLEERI